jgi:hypothetical protein
MRNRLAVLIALGVVCLAAVPPTAAWAEESPKTAVKTPKDTVPLESLLAEVRETLAVAEQLARQKDLPPLESVTLGLQTVAVTETGHTVKLFIFKFGTTTTTRETNTIVLTLTPPPPSTTKGVAQIKSNLVGAMLAASEAVKAARGTLPGLEAKQVACEYSFGVTKEGTGGLTLEVLPISVDAHGATSRQGVQTITVSFKKP